MSEHDQQSFLFDWAKKMESRHPQLKMLFAIPNGGLRQKVVAAKLKREGVKAGVPDIFLAIPIQDKEYGFGTEWSHGLFIEMKFGKNKLTPNQNEWMDALRKEGFKCGLCFSWIEAKDMIIKYLGLETQ